MHLAHCSCTPYIVNWILCTEPCLDHSTFHSVPCLLFLNTVFFPIHPSHCTLQFVIANCTLHIVPWTKYVSQCTLDNVISKLSLHIVLYLYLANNTDYGGKFGVHDIFVKPDLRLKPWSVVMIFF